MNKVIIGISNGQAFVVSAGGNEIEIRDYDVPDDWDGNVFIDDDGGRYQEILLDGTD